MENSGQISSQRMEDFDQSAENSGIWSKFENRTKNRRSLSLFDLTIEVVPANKDQKTEYEDALLKESKEWTNLLKEKCLDVERAEKTKWEIDKSVLTAAQRAYLEHALDLQKFVDESEEFCIKAQKYLLENSELVEMHDELTRICKACLSKVAADIIYDCIYAQKPLSSA